MSSPGGSGSGINSVEEAKRLLYGVPPEYDPAEQHMQRFLRALFGWTIVSVVVASAPLWLLGAVPSAIAVAAATVVVVGGIAWVRHRNLTRPHPLGNS